MYAQGKMPESIVTTETHQRVYDVTLSEPEAHDALCLAALRKVGINAAESTAKCRVSVYESDEDWNGDTEIIYSVVITEDLPIILPSPDEAPTDPRAFRLSRPNTGMSQGQINEALVLGKSLLGTNVNLRAAGSPNSYDGTAPWCSSSGTPIQPLNTTATSSRENINAIERMKRITRLHEVLLHGRGNNIVLSRGEVDTLLEILEHSAD